MQPLFCAALAIGSYDESLDEPGKLIADEPVEIEREVPAEENEPVEGTTNNSTEPPAFEE